MTPAQTGPDYEARIRRAQTLADRHSFAAEVLRFYQEIATFQQAFQTQIVKNWRKAAPHPASEFLRREPPSFETSALVLRVFSLLAMVEKAGPRRLAEASRHLQMLESSSLLEMWSAYRDVGGCNDSMLGAFCEFFARAFQEVVAAELSARVPLGPFVSMPSACPLCHSKPLLGILRPEGDGGKRSLVCSYCLKEWEFRRILCPACGEEDEKKLPVYVAEQFPHVRVEACDTCRSYVRTIDLTKDGHAVPLVDDLAALPLSLWAQERGYTRLRPNLLGT
jgi:formate dehydrogenase accessory protein FdhE